MARLGQTIGSGRRDDFVTVKQAADEVGRAPTTLKKWLNENKVPGVVWGTDVRGWYLVEKASIPKLKEHINSVRLAG